jgi:glycosyltransferase involved in cell wall biosynthesis
MALAKLVAVTDSPGVREYARARVSGLIVPASDAAALADVVN